MRVILSALLAALLMLGALISGCASHEHPDRAKDHDRYDRQDQTTYRQDRSDRYDPPVVRDDRDAWNRLHSDPVCGMTVNPKEAYTEYYQGSAYFFDTAECRRRFHDRPQAYIPGYEDRDHRYPDDRRPKDVK